MPEPIDSAFANLAALRREIDSYANTIDTEEDTRLKVIDRVLSEVLLWPLDTIRTEVHAGEGFADYVLGDGTRTRDGIGCVFPNLDGVRDNFQLFFDLLSYESRAPSRTGRSSMKPKASRSECRSFIARSGEEAARV